MRLLSGINNISRLPEFNVVVFALLLNYYVCQELNALNTPEAAESAYRNRHA